ncbi:MAG: hypothetical protein LBO62_04065 [Endomicrobium sp.]|nr:hypothetical protein [Endomicrobium sp.]
MSKVEHAGIAHSRKELKMYMSLAQDNLRDKNQYDKIKRFVRRLELLQTAIIEIAGQEYIAKPAIDIETQKLVKMLYSVWSPKRSILPYP